MNRRYLIVSYFYAPDVSPRALRWRALAEHWSSQGNHIDVICGWQPGLAHNEFLGGVYVHRVFSAQLEKLHSWFRKPSVDSRIQSAPSARPNSARRARGKLAAPARWLFKRTYWPDGGFLWYSPALKQAHDLILRTEYDAQISVSNYFTAHLVGLRIKKDVPHLRWLVDIGDPFSFLDIDPPNNRWLYGSLNHRAERNVFRQADMISVTTQPTLDRYAAIFTESASKIYVIPPLLSATPDTSTAPPIFPQDDNKIRLVFTGRLYPGVRSPELLLKLFAALLQTPLADRLELHFFGYSRETSYAFEPYSTLVGNKIFLHGVVSHAEVAQALREANILVNIGNKTPYQLPSKVVEYASTGKPILNLAQVEDDSSAQFFSAYPAALNLIDTGHDALPDQVNALYQFIENPPSLINPTALRKWLSSFELDAIAAAYDSLILAEHVEKGPTP